ncbi:MAG: hypothetical protein FWD73_14635, partial [Polyangiaceae bacterium]|nr:hypothetical protein [Polyangiaceae bacterium]
MSALSSASCTTGCSRRRIEPLLQIGDLLIELHVRHHDVIHEHLVDLGESISHLGTELSKVGAHSVNLRIDGTDLGTKVGAHSVNLRIDGIDLRVDGTDLGTKVGAHSVN